MRKGFFIGLGLLLIMGCNQSGKAGQQKLETVTDSKDTIQNVEANVSEQGQEDADEFYRQFPIESLKALLIDGGTENAEKCGMSLIYTDEFEDEEESLSYLETVFGRDIEKTTKKDLGWNLKATSSHACIFQANDDTSQSMYMRFVNQADANCVFERLVKTGVLDFDGEYIIPEEKLPVGDPVRVESFGDYQPSIGIHAPEFENGYYSIFFEVYM